MDYIMRSAQLADFEQGLSAAEELVGQGMTGWPYAPDILLEKHKNAVKTFAGEDLCAEKQLFLLVAERPDGEIAGWSGIYPSCGYYPSWKVEESEDRKKLTACFNLSNTTEVGTMFLKKKYQSPEHKIKGLGKALSRTRFMLIANEPERFSTTVFAEYRPYHDENGRFPFAEWFAREHFEMSASELNIEIGKRGHEEMLKWIVDWRGHDVLHCSQLEEDVREGIGKPHSGSVPAQKILTKENFMNGMVSFYDTGPQAVAERDKIHTVKNSRILRVAFGEVETPPALVSTASLRDFRAVSTPVKTNSATAILPFAMKEALHISHGDYIRVGPEAIAA